MITFWIIVLYGTTQIIVESVLFKPIRGIFNNIYTKPIYILLTCMMCTSTWLGFLYSLWWWSPSLSIFQQHFILNKHDFTWFIDGIFGSCIVWFIYLFEQFITSKMVESRG